MMASTRTKGRPSLSMKTLGAAVSDSGRNHQADGLPSNSKLGAKVHPTAGVQGMESTANRSVKRAAGTESTKSSLALKKAATPSTSASEPEKVDPSKQQKETHAQNTAKQDSKKLMQQENDVEKVPLALQNNDAMPSTSTRNVCASPTYTQDSDSPLEIETAFNHLYPSTQEEGLVYWDWRGQVDGVAGESPKKRRKKSIIKNCDLLPPNFNEATNLFGRASHASSNVLKRKLADDSMAPPPAKKANDDNGGFSLLEMQLAMNPVADSPNDDTGDESFDCSFGLSAAMDSPDSVVKRKPANKPEEKEETRPHPPCQCSCAHQARKAETVTVSNEDDRGTASTEITSHTSTVEVANIIQCSSNSPETATYIISRTNSTLTSATNSKSHPNSTLASATSRESHSNITTSATNSKSHPNSTLASATNSKSHPNSTLTSATNSKSHPNSTLASATNSKSHPNSTLTSVTSRESHPNITTRATNSQSNPNTTSISATNSKSHPNTTLTSATNNKLYPNTATRATSSKSHPNTNPTSSKSHSNTPTSSKSHPNTPTSATSSKVAKKDNDFLSPLRSAFYQDDSMTECLIACSIQAEEECRKSQEMQEKQQVTEAKQPTTSTPIRQTHLIKQTKPATSTPIRQVNLLRKPASKPMSNNKLSTVSSGGLEFVTSNSQAAAKNTWTVPTALSLRRSPRNSAGPSQKPASQRRSPRKSPKKNQISTEAEKDFNPSWMENIRQATSPLNASLSSLSQSMAQPKKSISPQEVSKKSQESSKSISRTLFSPNDATKKIASPKNLTPPSHSSPPEKNSESNFNSSFDIFEDSFDSALLDIDKIEAQYLSQMAQSDQQKMEPQATVNIPKVNSTETAKKPLPPKPLPAQTNPKTVSQPKQGQSSVASSSNTSTSKNLTVSRAVNPLKPVQNSVECNASNLTSNKALPLQMVEKPNVHVKPTLGLKTQQNNVDNLRSSNALPGKAQLMPKPNVQVQPTLGQNNVNNLRSSNALPGKAQLMPKQNVQVQPMLGQQMQQNNVLPGKAQLMPKPNVQAKPTLGPNNINNLRNNNALLGKTQLMPKPNVPVKPTLGQQMQQNNVAVLKSNNVLPDKSMPQSMQVKSTLGQTNKSPTVEASSLQANTSTQHLGKPLNPLSNSRPPGLNVTPNSSVTPASRPLNQTSNLATSKMTTLNNNNITKTGQSFTGTAQSKPTILEPQKSTTSKMTTLNNNNNITTTGQPLTGTAQSKPTILQPPVPCKGTAVQNNLQSRQLKAPAVENSVNKVIPKIPYHKTICGSPLSRHKSADFNSTAEVRPAPSNVQNLKSSAASPFVRHRSAGDVTLQASQQKYTAEEIERKRLEARQRLLQRKQQQR